MAKKKYIVTDGYILPGGEYVYRGESVLLDDEEAAPYLEKNAIAPVSKPKKEVEDGTDD